MIDPVEVFDVGTWPMKWRLVFLFTIPISGPLYMLACVGFAVFLLIMLALVNTMSGIMYLWYGKYQWKNPNGRKNPVLELKGSIKSLL